MAGSGAACSSGMMARASTAGLLSAFIDNCWNTAIVNGSGSTPEITHDTIN